MCSSQYNRTLRVLGDIAMATIPKKHFDILEFVKKAKEFGIKEEFAEYQARQIEQLNEVIHEQQQEYTNRLNALEAKEPANKKDLEVVTLELQKEISNLAVKIEQYRYDSLKFTVWTGIGVVVAFGGMLAKGFHWF